MYIRVVRDGVVFICRSEEQLKLFLSAGYVEEKPQKEEIKPKKTK